MTHASTTPARQETLRSTARRLFDAALRAADPAVALRGHLKDTPLPVPGAGGRLILIAVGKAAPAMLTEALAHLPARADHVALAITQYGNEARVPGATVLQTAHPVPDRAGLDAGRRVLDLLDRAGPADRIVALISGGGSALLPAPAPGLSLEDKAAVNRLLLANGLDIVQMNLIRQQLSQLKGGGFLRHAAPATVTAYILSDVIGDDLRAIASGPTARPIGTRQDAAELIHARGFWHDLPPAVQAHLSADAPAPETSAARNTLIGSNRHSLAAMREAAHGENWHATIVDDALTGDVADAARRILHAAQAAPESPVALIFGGETTVQIRGDGRGGRNQELALRVALGAARISRPWVFLSGGTDGRDGPTDAAGGIVDAGTAPRIAAAGRDAAALLANNDSYAALGAAGDLLITGASGTNVADVQVLMLG
ncbi:glycerate kinase type-2 family protein [Brevirhabdus sp.]|uniref:glycerate kinase type-2 family protein n=1 Tax=Brevirhabdus sp. TaxID=2004514 RepID=UPI004058E07A